MNWWLVAVAVLLVGGLAPALWLASRRAVLRRLIGVQLAVIVPTPVLLLVAQAAGQPSYLIMPLAVVVTSFADTLVYTRVLRP